MPKPVWVFLIAFEALVISAFAVVIWRSRYFQGMPETVRHGATIERLVGLRVLYLVFVFSVVNLSFWLWSRGVRAIERGERPQGAAILGTSLVVFIFAGLSFIALIIFGFAQY